MQTQIGDAFAEGVTPFQRLLIGQAGDAVARPQVTQGGITALRDGCCVDRQGLAERTTRGLAFDDQVAFGFTPPFAKHDDGAFTQHIGQLTGLHVVHVQTVKLCFDAG